MDGVTYMRMKFHVSGSKRKGEVFMDLKKVCTISFILGQYVASCLWLSTYFVLRFVLQFCSQNKLL